jgi:hypothetical protein
MSDRDGITIIRLPSFPGTGEILRRPGLRQWAMNLELTFPILDEDITHRYEGDAEVDYAERAVERIRPVLERLIAELGGGYYLSRQADRNLARRVM